MTIVWFFSLICMSELTEVCGYADRVLMPNAQMNRSREECMEAGRKFAVGMKLPAGKWAVVCFDGEVVNERRG